MAMSSSTCAPFGERVNNGVDFGSWRQLFSLFRSRYGHHLRAFWLLTPSQTDNKIQIVPRN